ncbi:bifunctional folylpolyglutamate synthase/dihydrofolate synthase [Candidatus Woesearchaeota archaeon]|nr:bifunctional folylpolyglutamate synthase/dihydrofolate synthase [Candidatus Woesearchaeota archaeon]
MGYKQILAYLYSLESPKIKLGLGRVQQLLDRIGNPEKSLRFIHVAGTNGKGSVCAMLQSVLMESGYKVGMYTSPHLKRFNERIRIGDTLISDREIVDYFLKIKPYIANQSFFEITTAMAFLYFHEKKADFIILEVGLGGRLDATNVVTPLVSVITNIGLEHTDLLGKAVEKIAFEKSGIIKKNVPIVTGTKGGVLKIIKNIADGRNAPLFISKRYPKIELKYLNGSFQQLNKDIALNTIDTLRKFHEIKINKNKIIRGLKKTKWPARMQFISKNVLVDAAHNPDGFKVLAKELKLIKNSRNAENFIFVIGIQNDKKIETMLKTINHLMSKIIFTKSNNPKASEPVRLLRTFNKINKNKEIQTKIINNPKKALKYAKKIAGERDLAVVTGSIYMVGEVM